jgi:hypothetical protein
MLFPSVHEYVTIVYSACLVDVGGTELSVAIRLQWPLPYSSLMASDMLYLKAIQRVLPVQYEVGYSKQTRFFYIIRATDAVSNNESQLMRTLPS